jgi:WD40 repeat protein
MNQTSVNFKPGTKSKEVTSKDSHGIFRPVRLSSEVNDMILIWQQDYKQILACDKDCFFILNDTYSKGDPRSNDAELMRIVTGQHSDDICCLGFSWELSLIVTGSASGQVCVCDYESSKIQDYCVAHEAEITSI